LAWGVYYCDLPASYSICNLVVIPELEEEK